MIRFRYYWSGVDYFCWNPFYQLSRDVPSVTDMLTRIETPEERELSRYLLSIEGKKLEVAAAQAEAETLRDDLARFNAEYHACVGVVLIKLNKAVLELEEYQRRIDILQQDQNLSPDDIDQRIHREFSEKRENIDREDEQSARFRQQSARFAQEPALTKDESVEQKRLFRELARRFHPDLAKTDAERIARTRIMQKVTAAFHNRNLEILRQLSSQPDVDDRSFDMISIGEQLIWAIRELARLDALLDTLSRDMHQMRSSALGVLWTSRHNGEDVIWKLQRDALRRLEAATMKLQDIRIIHERLREQG